MIKCEDMNVFKWEWGRNVCIVAHMLELLYEQCAMVGVWAWRRKFLLIATVHVGGEILGPRDQERFTYMGINWNLDHLESCKSSVKCSVRVGSVCVWLCVCPPAAVCASNICLVFAYVVTDVTVALTLNGFKCLKKKKRKENHTQTNLTFQSLSWPNRYHDCVLYLHIIWMKCIVNWDLFHIGWGF